MFAPFLEQLVFSANLSRYFRENIHYTGGPRAFWSPPVQSRVAHYSENNHYIGRSQGLRILNTVGKTVPKSDFILYYKLNIYIKLQENSPSRSK